VDGNPVKSEEIFAQNKITMVNIWATWCGNCVGELAGLAEMNHRLADKNVAVIGICNDADTEPDKCKALIEENGVDYLNLMPVDDLDKMLEIPGLPTSYFVDSEGKILCAPFIGAPMEMVAYEKVIDSLLADEEVVVERGMPVNPNSEGVYRVIVTDSDGDFVPGVRVQFCSDSFCMMGKTDENGVAVFKAEEGTVDTAHIMKFPDGYVPNADEYKTSDTYCDVYIVLQKK
jgi:thiol-disulfide isomerase/thioredoxin